MQKGSSPYFWCCMQFDTSCSFIDIVCAPLLLTSCVEDEERRRNVSVQIFIWDYIHQARYKIKPIIDVKKVTSAYKGNERCTIQA
jgi:hypothetical protein